MRSNLTRTCMFNGKNIRKYEIIAEIYMAHRVIIGKGVGYFYAEVNLKEWINDENQTIRVCRSSVRVH